MEPISFFNNKQRFPKVAAVLLHNELAPTTRSDQDYLRWALTTLPNGCLDGRNPLYVISGEFLSGSNRMAICNAMETLGYRRAKQLNRNVRVVIYSSSPTAELGNKLDEAAEMQIPIQMNEAAACAVLGVPFSAPAKPVAQDHGRKRGKSSRAAMGYLLEAWCNEGRVVHITDHFPTPAADRMCAGIVQDMISTLNLKGFVVDSIAKTVVFNGY